MPTLSLDNVCVKHQGKTILSNLTLSIDRHQRWVIVGPNGSGKSFLAKLLSHQVEPSSGVLKSPLTSMLVSFETVGRILDHERYLDSSNTCGGFDNGTPTETFIFRDCLLTEKQKSEICAKFNLKKLMKQGIKLLSTGEMRKATICKAIVTSPELLILDEPFEGLDQKSRTNLHTLIKQIINEGTQVILLLNRHSEIPPETTHVATMRNGQILRVEETHNRHRKSDSTKQDGPDTSVQLPDNLRAQVHRQSPETQTPVIEMHQVNVRYQQKWILRCLDWSVQQGQHWLISGPNGSGKTTLAGLVSGDHTQGYANDIKLFGRAKGSGESLGEIKSRIGSVSTSFQHEYRVRCSVAGVILSGFFDSIGVYKKYSQQQLDIVDNWLRILNLYSIKDCLFQNLSFGQQRLALLARAW